MLTMLTETFKSFRIYLRLISFLNSQNFLNLINLKVATVFFIFQSSFLIIENALDCAKLRTQKAFKTTFVQVLN